MGEKKGEKLTYEFKISGKLIGMNQWIDALRANKYKGAALKKREQERVEYAICRQLKGLHITNPVNIYYMFYEPNMRRDKDNIAGFAHKVIQDALVVTKVLQNDGWKNVKDFHDCFGVDKKNPGIVVMLEEVEVAGKK